MIGNQFGLVNRIAEIVWFFTHNIKKLVTTIVPAFLITKKHPPNAHQEGCI